MFKSLMIYRVTKPVTLQALRGKFLENQLESHPATDPEGGQWRRIGFGPTSSISNARVYDGPNGVRMFTVHFAERNLPGAVIKEHLNARVAKLEDMEGRKVYKKEAAQMRDEVEAALLPKAFIKRSHVRMMLIDDMLVLDCSSAKKAEDALGILREAIGSLGIRPLTPKSPARSFMNDLVLDNFDTSTGFTPRGVAKLEDADGGRIGLKDVELNDEVQALLTESQYQVVELGMTLLGEYLDDGEPVARFVLTEKFVVKSFKLDGMLVERITSESQDEAAAELDGTVIIFADVVRLLVSNLIDAMGEFVPPTPADTDDELVQIADALKGRTPVLPEETETEDEDDEL